MSGSERRSWTGRVFVNGSEGRLRAGWRLFAGVVTYALALLVAVLATGTLLAVAGAVLPLAADRIVPVAFASQLFWNVAATGLLIALAWGVDARTIPDIGLGGRGWWSNLGIGLVLGVAMTSAVFAVELAAGLITVRDVLVARPGLGIGGLGFGPALALTFLLFVAVGVGEEVFFRGYLMTNLAEGLNGLGPVGPRGAIAAAALVSSALFGFVHATNQNATALATFNIAVVGLFLAGAYVATDDLGIPSGVHITWNFSLSSVYGFPVSGITTPATVLDVRQTGDPLVTGGAFGPEAGLVVYLALVVAVAITWWWVRRTKGPVGFPTGVAVPELRTATETDDATGDQRRLHQTTGDGED